MAGSGVSVGGDVGAWFSRFLDVEGCRVIYMSPRHKGRVLHTDPRFGHLARLDNEVSIVWVWKVLKYCMRKGCQRISLTPLVCAFLPF